MFQELTSKFHAAFQGNQFISGGIFLGFVGGLIAYAKNLPRNLWDRFLLFFSVQVEIRKHDELFELLEQWLGNYKRPRFSRNFVATYTPEIDDSDGNELARLFGKGSNPALPPGLKFTVGTGTHRFIHERTLFNVDRITPKSDKAYNPFDNETFNVRVFTRNKRFVEKFFGDLLDITKPAHEVTRIYQRDKYDNHWTLIKKAKKKSINNLVFQEGIVEDLKQDIQRFMDNEKWFVDMGIPYKRGYLFSGPPGNGKTSTIVALASYFNRPIYILQEATNFKEADLTYLFSKLPRHAFVVFEDIDTLFANEKTPVETTEEEAPDAELDSDGFPRIERVKKKNKPGRIQALGALLNTLDGILTPDDGHIVFMTSNHPEKLDPALIRPGRVDRKIVFHNADAHQAKTLGQKFFKDSTVESLEKFAETVNQQQISMAQLKEILIQSNSIDDATDRASKFKLKVEKDYPLKAV